MLTTPMSCVPCPRNDEAGWWWRRSLCMIDPRDFDVRAIDGSQPRIGFLKSPGVYTVNAGPGILCRLSVIHHMVNLQGCQARQRGYTLTGSMSLTNSW